jgi:hypothetical protein
LSKSKFIDLNYARVKRYPEVFQRLSGLSVTEFDEVVKEVELLVHTQLQADDTLHPRHLAVGGGRKFALSLPNQILATLIWLHCYPKQSVLATLFAVHRTTLARALERVLPLLNQTIRDKTMRTKPGYYQGRDYSKLVETVPELLDLVYSMHLSDESIEIAKT